MRSDKVCQCGVVGCQDVEATSADLFVDSIVMETTAVRDNEGGVVLLPPTLPPVQPCFPAKDGPSVTVTFDHPHLAVAKGARSCREVLSEKQQSEALAWARAWSCRVRR